MKVLCVLNPRAAGGLALERWPAVAALLTRLGATYDLLASTPGVPLAEEVCGALEHMAPVDGVVGIGGDGTHFAAINGLMRFRQRHPEATLPPYSFVALGTGNDIAKSLGIRIEDAFSTRDLQRAVSTVIHGADYRLDLGVIDGLYFADALTVGLDSAILQERNISKRLLEGIPWLRFLTRGRFLYTLSTGQRFFREQPVQGTITVDDRVWYEGPMLNVVVNNTRIYAGGFDFSMDAYADDGLLDVVLFTGHTDYLARYLMAIRRNPDHIRSLSEELSKRAQQVQGRRIGIKLQQPQPAQVDGEELPAGDHFEVCVLPRAIHIKTPAEPV
jgi:diacylglycerol kinase family enzyme